LATTHRPRAKSEPPTTGQGRNGKRYRYYVSAPLQQGQRTEPDGAVRRVAAAALEVLVVERLKRLTEQEDPDADLLRRVQLRFGDSGPCSGLNSRKSGVKFRIRLRTGAK
jgi:hypothetical protein